MIFSSLGLKEKCKIQTQMENKSLIFLVQVISGIFLIPFIVVDLDWAYNGDQGPCLDTVVSNVSLRGWFVVDAATKIAIYTALWFFSALSTELAARKMLLICQTTLLRFYYYFLLGWVILGSVIYWGNIYPVNECDSGLNAYFFALFIISYVEVILNIFVITCLRGVDSKDEDETIVITHR